MTRLPHLRNLRPVYTRARIEKLGGLALNASWRIGARLDTQALDHLADAGCAWGQYLDIRHHGHQQWGLLGTSAGLQALGIISRREPTAPGVHRIAGALALLPEDLANPPTATAGKLGPPKNDARSVFRVAWMAAGLRPDLEVVPQANRPAIVTTVLAAAHDGQRWAPRSLSLHRSDGDGDVFMTAWVLYCLRRFEDGLGREFEAHRRWLASKVLDGDEVSTRIHYAGLAGLALLPAGGRQPLEANPHESGRIEEARKRIDELIREWRARRRGAVEVSRPMFEGFNVGGQTDYTFVNPELLAALYCLRRGSPKSTRKYVVQTVERVQSQIQDDRGFEGQVGMEPTVDQVWAVELLDEFRGHAQDPLRAKQLRPPWTPSDRQAATIVAFVAVVLGLVVTAVSNSAFAGAIAGVALFGAQFLISLGKQE